MSVVKPVPKLTLMPIKLKRRRQSALQVIAGSLREENESDMTKWLEFLIAQKIL